MFTRIGGAQPQSSSSAQPTTIFHQQPQQRRFIDDSQSFSDNPTAMQIDGEDEGGGGGNDHQSRRSEQREASASSSAAKEKADEEAKKKRELSKPNLDGLCCSICMDPWGSQGDHQVSCLSCGHVFGLSCIRRWIQRCGENSSKCPQCNAKCMLKDIRKLYSSPVFIFDEVLQKKVESLKDEIGTLKTERAELLNIQDNLLNLQDNLLEELRQLKEKSTCLKNVPFGELRGKPFGFVIDKEAQGGQSGCHFGLNFGKSGILHCNFVLEHELAVEDARLFDMDISYQILILARRISGMGGTHMLNKINLINPQESEDIQLPPSTRAVKDLRVSPCGRLALLASLGKKLSILSMGSNNTVITYDLLGPAWSCSWDLNSPHFIYAGLQNGMILMFDMRQTSTPLQAMVGLTSRPIHTIHSLINNPADSQSASKLLTASSMGPYMWNTANARERPTLVPGSENQGICMSLAYGPSSDDIVASYRPKVPTYDITVSAPSLYPHSVDVLGQGILGSQVLVKRVTGSFCHNMGSASAYLSNVQMTKSAIVNMENCFPLFAYGDEATRGLRLRELPSLTVSQNLKPLQHPILDVKFAQSQGSGLLGCVSEQKLQLFSAEVS